MMKKYLAIIALFPLFHIQTVNLGPITIDQMIKLTIVFLSIKFAFDSRKIIFRGLDCILILRSLKSILIFGNVISISSIIMEGIRFFSAWAVYATSRAAPNAAAEMIRFAVYTLTVFAIPYLLGLATPLSSGFDLSIYGGDGAGFVGSFLNPHSAGITHSACVLYIASWWIQGRKERLFGHLTAPIFFINLTVVYLSFARTAWLMTAVGLLVPLLVLMRRDVRAKLYIPLIVFACIVAASASEAVVNRLMDVNSYHTDRSDDLIASGRLIFWRASLNIFEEMNFAQMWLGIGRESAVVEMYNRIGRSLESHNGFLDTLLQQGIIGCILEFIQFYMMAHLSLNQLKKGTLLPMSMTMAYFAMYVFQGGSFFYWDLIYFGSIGYLSATRRKSVVQLT